jgi:predicted porin
MQKKIIALAIASALTAPALAFADATVYGQANLSVDIVNDGLTNSARTNQLNSNTSRLGVKGSEDLGSGLSAIAQLEGTVALDSAGTATTGLVFNRNTFLGLSSTTLGTAVAGEHDTPYKMATRNLDLFADGIADNRGNQSTSPTFGGTPMMGGGQDIRPGNVIAYISPAMSGFTVAAATAFGAESATATAGNNTKGSIYSLAGMYDQGPFYAALAYQTIKFGDVGTGSLAGVVNDKTSAFKVGGSYTMNAFAVNAVIERITNTTALTGTDLKNTNVYLAGKFNITSADDVKLAFTKRGSQTGLANDAKQYTVGYDHSLSKATSVYALYTKLTQNATGAGVSADPSALSLGIKHSF